jgi:hypothetical protein
VFATIVLVAASAQASPIAAYYTVVVPGPAPDTSQIVAVRSGDVAVVDVTEREVKLPKGGSAREFSLEPPSGAECPGDSMHDSWRVQTFIVPATDDPGALAYGVIGPTGTHQYAVYDKFTAPVTDVLTVANAGAGLTARIDMLPPMSFAVFPPGELPDGRYRIGVACTFFGKTANFWDTEIVISASASDQPAHFVWSVPSVPDTSSASSHGSSGWLIAGVGLLAALSLGGLAWYRNSRRMRRTRTTPIKQNPPINQTTPVNQTTPITSTASSSSRTTTLSKEQK